MSLFNKKKEKPPEIKLQKIYLKNNIEAHKAGVAVLATDYFMSLPAEERVRVQVILFEVTDKDFQGTTILEAMHTLNAKQLLEVQKRIEQEFKVVRH
jgi:hypothetical protein